MKVLINSPLKRHLTLSLLLILLETLETQYESSELPCTSLLISRYGKNVRSYLTMKIAHKLTSQEAVDGVSATDTSGDSGDSSELPCTALLMSSVEICQDCALSHY